MTAYEQREWFVKREDVAPSWKVSWIPKFWKYAQPLWFFWKTPKKDSGIGCIAIKVGPLYAERVWFTWLD